MEIGGEWWYVPVSQSFAGRFLRGGIMLFGQARVFCLVCGGSCVQLCLSSGETRVLWALPGASQAANKCDHYNYLTSVCPAAPKVLGDQLRKFFSHHAVGLATELTLWCARDSPAGARVVRVSVLPMVYVIAPSFVFKLKKNFLITFKDVRIERVLRKFGWGSTSLLSRIEEWGILSVLCCA